MSEREREVLVALKAAAVGAMCGGLIVGLPLPDSIGSFVVVFGCMAIAHSIIDALDRSGRRS